MESFNSLVAKYVKSNPNVSLSSISEQMENIQKSLQEDIFKSCKPSVFTVDGEVTKKELTDFINTAGGTSLDKETETLFDILDQNGDGKLDDSELQLLKRKNGTIDSFSFWVKTNVNKEQINKINGYSVSSNFNKENSEQKSNSTLVSSAALSVDDNSINSKTSKEINEIAQKIAAGEDDLSDYTSVLTYDDYILLEAAVEKAQKDNSTVVSNGNAGSVDNNTSEKELEQKTNEVTVNIEQYVEDLHNAMEGIGTDEEELMSIMFDNQIPDEDFAKIVKMYQDKYGVGLISEFDDETSGDFFIRLSVKMAERLKNAANKGNKEAIDAVCKELYDAAANQTIGTSEEFVETLLDEDINSKVLSKIVGRYSEINKGHTLIDDIKNDYTGFLGWTKWMPGHHNAAGEGADIIKRIKQAQRYIVEN